MLEVRTTKSRRRKLCLPEDREGGLPRRFCKPPDPSRPSHAAPAIAFSGLHFNTREAFAIMHLNRLCPHLVRNCPPVRGSTASLSPGSAPIPPRHPGWSLTL